MAFNPFRAFRKHQKLIFAVLVVMAMFVFVFTSSTPGTPLNDLFVSLASKLGWGKGANNEVVARVNDSKKTEQDLIDLATRRAAALSVWLEANYTASQNNLQRQQKLIELRTEIFKKPDKDSFERLRAEAQPVEEEKERLNAAHIFLVGAQSPVVVEPGEDIRQRIMFLRYTMGYAQMAMTQRQLSVDSLLDFMMWQKLADNLSIYLSPEDASKLFKKENSGKKAEDLFKGLRVHNRFARLKDEEVMEALTEEFRVRLAMEAVLGHNGTPAPVSPYDFWKSFERNRAQDRVAMLPISVENYLDQVKDKPADGDLRRLFNENEKSLPTPDREKPAFMEPHRIELSWLEANPNLPALEIQATVAPELIKLFNPCQATAYDMLMVYDYEKDTSATGKTDPIERTKPGPYAAPPWDVQNYEMAYSIWLLPMMDDCKPSAVAAAVGRGFGASLANNVGFGATFVQECELNASPERKAIAKHAAKEHDEASAELNASVQAGTALTALNPSFDLVSSLWLAGAEAQFLRNPYLPFEVVKRRIQLEDQEFLINGRPKPKVNGQDKVMLPEEEAKEEKEKLQENGFKTQYFTRVTKDLEGLKNRSRDDAKKTIEEVLDKYSTMYALSDASMEKLRKDRVTDPVIDKLARIKDVSMDHAMLKKQLGELLSADELTANEETIVKSADKLGVLEEKHSTGARDQYELVADPAMKPLVPEKIEPGDTRSVSGYFDDGLHEFDVRKKDIEGATKQTILYWKSKDVEKRVPSYDKETKAKVLEAWRFIQARKLALKDANSLIDKAKEDGKVRGRSSDYPADAMRTLEDQRAKWAPQADKPFEESGIYLLDNKRGGGWQPSMPDKEHILYPPDDFAKQIHEKLSAVGDAFVMTDKPGKHCYVVVLEQREEVKPSEMAKHWEETYQGSLGGQIKQEALEKHRNAILHELRKNAGLETDEVEVDDKKPKLDQFGDPIYKKTYKVTEELTKKVQGDLVRE